MGRTFIWSYLALLMVPNLNIEPMKLSPHDESVINSDGVETPGVSLAQDVLLMAYSLGLPFLQVTTGNINGIQNVETVLQDEDTPIDDRFLDPSRSVYIYDLLSTGGSSGGPVLNGEGEVIGINFAEFTNISNIEYGFAIQVKHLRNLLAQDRNFTAVP
ncbi:MAG: trypsin-like peptidase domain-containing protein [Oligoflexales bacterium]|nr:trypsin-like peptidase domain-containing protein [Oligoflexales bacterium]